MNYVLELPHSCNIEHCLLGCMINDIEHAKDAAADLTKEIFYYTKHREIFEVITSLVEKDRKPDVSIILEELKKKNGAIDINDFDFLRDLSNKMALSSQYNEYVHELKDLQIRRQAINSCDSTIREMDKGKSDTYVVLDRAIKKLSGIDCKEASMRHLKEIIVSEMILEEMVEKSEYYQEHKSMKRDPNIMKTGFWELDSIIDGLHPSRLYILGARPAVGKTALVMNIAQNIAKKGGKVGIFSLEMSERELIDRYVASASEKMLMDIQHGSITPQDLEEVKGSVNKVQEHKIWIDQKNFKLRGIKREIRRQKRENDIGLVVIDYLQLIHLDDPNKAGNRNFEITEISRQLKLMAKEFNVAILCLSQLSRNLESRNDKRPMLSDLRDSGSIEQDADVVMLLSRNGNTTNVFVAKNRHGTTGKATLIFKKEIVKFKEQ